MKLMEFWVGPLIVNQPGRYVLSPELPSRFPSYQLIPIAYYGRSFGGAALSQLFFDQTGRYSQAGIFIHEALRHVQMIEDEGNREGRGQSASLSDVTIQEVTARIILQDPRPGDSLLSEERAGSTIGSQMAARRHRSSVRLACQRLRDLDVTHSIELATLRDKVCAAQSALTPLESTTNALLAIVERYEDVRQSVRSKKVLAQLSEIRKSLRESYEALLSQSLSETDLENRQLIFRLKSFLIMPNTRQF